MNSLVPQIYRRPRNRLLLNGASVGPCAAIETSGSNRAQAASFFVRLALSSGNSNSAQEWLNADNLEAQIDMGFLPVDVPEGLVDWQEMIAGVVDRIGYDPVSGSVTLEGRDYASRLLDLPITEAFLNTTSSDVAQELASRCGLTCVCDPTSTMVGQYYQIEHSRQGLVRLSKFGNAWDLLCSLAQFEGYDLWVQGTTLYFVAANRDPAHSVNLAFTASPGSGSPSLNVSRLLVERTLALAAIPTVQVSSWNSRQRLRVTAQAGGGAGAGSTMINVVRPNLLQDTANMLASGIHGQTAPHKQILAVTMPGELTLGPRDRLVVSGVGPSWDGNYRIDSLDREMTLDGGFTQSLVGKMEVN